MRVITEIELRDQYKKDQFTSFNLPDGCRLTPAAAQFLSERRIPVVTAGSSPGGKENSHKLASKVEEKKRDQTYSINEFNNEKPEHMTHLKGSTLVLKNHPRIKFRGKMDTFEALLITTIIDVDAMGFQELARDLKEILEYVKQMLRAEVMEEPLEPINFHGWSLQEIRERSHYPKKYYGINHLLPDPGKGKLMAQINLIRAQVRELELMAIEAFCPSPDVVEREDILQALNRLSSVIYIMMIQLASGQYRPGC